MNSETLKKLHNSIVEINFCLFKFLLIFYCVSTTLSELKTLIQENTCNLTASSEILPKVR